MMKSASEPSLVVQPLMAILCMKHCIHGHYIDFRQSKFSFQSYLPESNSDERVELCDKAFLGF